MKRPNASHSPLLLWALFLGVWSLMVMAFAGQLVFTRSAVDPEFGWGRALQVSLGDWFPWILLTPAIAWLATHFPIERPKLLVNVLIHLAACIAAVLACELVSRPGAPVPGPPRGGPLRFADRPPEDRPPFRRGPGGPEDFPPDRPFRPDGRPPEGRPPEGQLPPGPAQRGFLLNAVIRARVNVPVYWIIVSIAHALTYYRRSQERERRAVELEARLADAKLEALRMQLHPHFLFNTLNAISTLVHKDPHAADEMIGNLSELLRATLDTSQPEIPLRQELEFLESYLEIQQVRFGDRLRIEKEIDTTALEAQVPTLILQPLVENAVRHGIEPQAAPGLVQIGARREGEFLRLSVHDSGSGGGAALPANRSREGIGLPNTRSRLNQLYGSRARLTLTSSTDNGFTAELEIPYREATVVQSETAGFDVKHGETVS